jgi:splicing factor 3B subunit 3
LFLELFFLLDRIVILDYNKEKNVLDKIDQETFGKSGARGIVPGEYIAVDDWWL